jgi:REP-associated tyrosine transposase
MPTEPGTPPRSLLLAKSAKGEYRRNLPHLQAEDKPLFVTFVTLNRWVLPELVRDLVLKHCLHDHRLKYHLHGVIVMPDHVHMIFSALTDDEGKSFGLAEIMNGIKGASAHTINKTLGRRSHSGRGNSSITSCAPMRVLKPRRNIFARIRFVKAWLRS